MTYHLVYGCGPFVSIKLTFGDLYKHARVHSRGVYTWDKKSLFISPKTIITSKYIYYYRQLLSIQMILGGTTVYIFLTINTNNKQTEL